MEVGILVECAYIYLFKLYFKKSQVNRFKPNDKSLFTKIYIHYYRVQLKYFFLGCN